MAAVGALAHTWSMWHSGNSSSCLVHTEVVVVTAAQAPVACFVPHAGARAAAVTLCLVSQWQRMGYTTTVPALAWGVQ